MSWGLFLQVNSRYDFPKSTCANGHCRIFDRSVRISVLFLRVVNPLVRRKSAAQGEKLCTVFGSFGSYVRTLPLADGYSFLSSFFFFDFDDLFIFRLFLCLFFASGPSGPRPPALLLLGMTIRALERFADPSSECKKISEQHGAQLRSYVLFIVGL